jgi:tetratricopeptide (TPR) repeat protein
MDMTNEILQTAMEFHKKNDLINAEKKYREYLKTNPNNSQCLFVLGTLLIQKESYKDAIIELNKSSTEDPKNYHTFQNLGIAYYETNQFDKAIFCYEKSIFLNNKNANAYNNLGLTLDKSKQYSEATKNFTRAIVLSPNKGFVMNRAKSFVNNKEYNSALEDLDSIEESSVLFRDAEDLKAKVYVAIGKHRDAIPILENRLKNYDKDKDYKKKFKKASIYAALNYAYIAGNEEDNDKIKKCMSEFEKEFPNSEELYRIKAARCFAEKSFEDAIHYYKKALEITPTLAGPNNDIGICYESLGDMDSSEFYFRKAIEIDPRHVMANVSLGIIHLKRKEFTKAWQHYEYRLLGTAYQSHKSSYIFFNPKLPKWDGSNNKSSVVIYGEQGIGDQIILSKLLTKIKNFQNQFTIVLDRRLLPIFKRSFPETNFNFADEKIGIEGFFDYQAAIFRLGFLFVQNEQQIRHPDKYLLADENNIIENKPSQILPVSPFYVQTGTRREVMAEINDDTTPKENMSLRCGLSWTSINRSIGDLKTIELNELIKASSNNDFEYVNLQYEINKGDLEKEISLAEMNNNIQINRYDNLDKLRDLDGLFSLVNSCDIVITISNVTAHIAGSLGKKTYLFLPMLRGQFWYWHKYKQTNTSLWYPSVEIIQSTEPNSFKGCLEILKNKLKTISS